jgi:MscS family membrane protein
MEGAMPSTVIVGSLVLSLFLAGPGIGPVAAQPTDKPTTPAQSAAEDPLGRETPRGAVLGFIRAAASQNYERAAQYLDARATPREASELARKLKTIVDRWLAVTDFDSLSHEPRGRLDDDLSPNLEKVGELWRDGKPVPILLERVERPGLPPIWLVSAGTLRLVPALYAEIELPWIERALPEPWRKFHLLGLPLWQWVMLLLAIPIVWALAWVLHRVLLKALRPLLLRLTGPGADAELTRVAAPLRLLTGAVALASWVALTKLPLLTRVFWTRVAGAVAIVGVGWLLFRLVKTVFDRTDIHFRLTNQIGRLAALELARRLAKIAVVVATAFALLYLGGLDLTAALAGLGIGGIALALAAQKTLENFFGGLMIISDQPVRVGDFCRIGDVVGVVEDIGLRSTRVRTLERTVVSIPNGQTAAVNVENFGLRDKIWFRPTIGLRLETTPEQLRYVLAEIRQMLYAHPMVETDSARIRLVRVSSSSLDLEVFSYVKTSDYTTFVEVQEDVLLRMLDIIEASGTALAFPSSTTYLARDHGLDREKAQAVMASVKRWREARELPFPNWRPEQIAKIDNSLEYPPADSAVRAIRAPD